MSGWALHCSSSLTLAATPSALNMRLAEMLGISLGVQNLCTNILFTALRLFWFGRKYIGLGTFVHPASASEFIITALRPHCGPLWPSQGAGPAECSCCGWRWRCRSRRWGFAVPDGRSGHRPVRLPLAGPAGLHPGAVLRLPRVHRWLCALLLCWLLGGLVGIGTDTCLLPGALVSSSTGWCQGSVHYKAGGQ